MRKFFYLTIVSIFFTNCSTAPIVESNINSNNSNFSTVVRKETNQPNTNVEVQTKSNTAQPQQLPPGFGDQLRAEKNKDTAVNVPPIQAKPLVKAAPDNSEISATMNSQNIPVETRIFKNNPMLAKVEKILTDVKNPEIKVYLKNGKVVDLPAGKISDTATASASDILTAAGVTPKSAPSKNLTKTEIEKSEH